MTLPAESIGPRPTCFLVGVPGHSAVAVDLVDASFSLPSQRFSGGSRLLQSQLDHAAKEDFYDRPPVQMGEPRKVFTGRPHFVRPIRQEPQGQNADVGGKAEHAILGLGIERIAGCYLMPRLPRAKLLGCAS